MPNATAVCYFSSLLFYGIGYSKTLLIENAVTEHINTYDYTIQISLATGCFVLAILLAVIGSVFFYIRSDMGQEIADLYDMEFRAKTDRRSKNMERLASISEVKDQFARAEYGLDLDRKMSS